MITTSISTERQIMTLKTIHVAIFSVLVICLSGCRNDCTFLVKSEINVFPLSGFLFANNEGRDSIIGTMEKGMTAPVKNFTFGKEFIEIKTEFKGKAAYVIYGPGIESHCLEKQIEQAR